MQEIYAESFRKVSQNKAKLEKELKVKIKNRGRLVFVEGKGEDEYLAIEVIEALNLGFKIEQALLLNQEGFILEKVLIKNLTKRHDLERIRGRLIGTDGRTRKTIENLSDCFLAIHDNTIGIIGRAEEIEKAMQAVESIIQGSKQNKVYSSLERKNAKEKTKLNEDLGLKG